MSAKSLRGRAGFAGPARRIVEICDEILRLGREGDSVHPSPVRARLSEGRRGKGAETAPKKSFEMPTVGRSRSGSAIGQLGRIGCAVGEEWVALRDRFHALGREADKLVRALDPSRPRDFYAESLTPLSGEPPEWELRMMRQSFLGGGKDEAWTEKTIADYRRMPQEEGLHMWTAPQWPSYQRTMHGRVMFFSPPEFVRDFEQRWGALRTWAAARLREMASNGAGSDAGQGKKTADARAAGSPARIPERPDFKLDRMRQRVRLSGKWYDLTDIQTQALSVLEKAKGAWVQGRLRGERMDKIRNSLPKPVRSTVAVQRGLDGGYRLNPDFFA